MSEPQGFLPTARNEGIIRKEVDGELLVYDLERDRAHCLNQSAAAIWKLCDGRSSPKEIAASLTDEVGTTVDERVVWLALADLRRTHLLEEPRDETQFSGPTASGVEPPDTKAASSPGSPDGQPGWGGRRRTPKVPLPQAILGMSRREAVKRIGLGAAIALPVVISITAPTPAQAASLLPGGSACSTSAECASGNCTNNVCV